MRHADRERGRATGTIEHRFLAKVLRQDRHLIFRYWKSFRRNFLNDFSRRPFHVDREILAGLKH